MQDGTAEYFLHKVTFPHKTHCYEWKLADIRGGTADEVVVKHGDCGHVAILEIKNGTHVLKLHQGGFSTLNRFKWGSKTYR